MCLRFIYAAFKTSNKRGRLIKGMMKISYFFFAAIVIAAQFFNDDDTAGKEQNQLGRYADKKNPSAD